MEVIIDDRERNVIPYLPNPSKKYHINYTIQRNEVGDYAILYKKIILLIIERKTWTDLAASMRDGRKCNVEKLLSLREKTNCQIAYMIEGNPCPSVNDRFGRIPVRALRAHLDHIAFRDGIHMIYSTGLEYTAERIFELAVNYLTIDDIIKDIDSKLSVIEKKGSNENVEELKTKQIIQKSSDEIILKCLPFIGTVISSLLYENNVTLYDLFHQKYTVEDIANIKYNTGAIIGCIRGKKIAEDIRKILISKDKKYSRIHEKILSSIPRISLNTAKIILANTTLEKILTGETTINMLANIKKSEKTKLGKKTSENIITYLISEKKITNNTKVDIG